MFSFLLTGQSASFGNWADIPSHLIHLTAAFVLALPAGWDRERHERSAGIRTFSLVAVGTCGYIIAVQGNLAGNPDAQSRLMQGLMTGIGFIGTGAILKDGASVTGTATAASIWVTGAMGAAVAYSQYDIGIVLSILNFVLLRWLVPLKSSNHSNDPSSS